MVEFTTNVTYQESDNERTEVECREADVFSGDDEGGDPGCRQQPPQPAAHQRHRTEPLTRLTDIV